MGTDVSIWDTDSYPDDGFGVWSTAHEFHNPSFVGIADGEGLATRVVAILFGEGSYDADGLTCGLCSLEGEVDEGTVVEDTGGVDHFFSSAIGGFCNCDLMFVDVANDIVGNLGFWDLPHEFMCFP